MSLGAAFQWPEYPTAQAVERLTRKGIVVAVSAGNSGDAGEFAVGAPGVGSAAIAVASFENDFLTRKAFLDPKGTPMAYAPMTYSPDPPASGQSPELVYVGLGTADSDFTNPDGTSKVQGKVALIQRGVIPFLDKSRRAQKFGAVQAFIMNNRPGSFLGTLQQPGNYIPTLSISQEDGNTLLAEIKQGPVHVTWSDKMYQFPNTLAGHISDFSSWGPSPDLAVKPDVTAPGGNIYSTFPVNQGSYATLSGTSMASPHVAGAAALILQARKEMFKAGSGGKVKATAIRTLLMNTAHPRTDGPDGPLAPVHRQGAGMIDIWKAITAKQRVTPEKIALGPVAAGATLTQQIVVENLADQPQTYTFHVMGQNGKGLALANDLRPLTVKARATGSTTLTLTVPADTPEGLFSGWIAVQDGTGEDVAFVPYLGYQGDYRALPVLDPLIYGLPWLARLDGPFLYKSNAIEIHPNCNCDAALAWIIFSLGRQTPELRLEIWDPASGKKYGEAFREHYLGRSAGGFELYTWDGTNDKLRSVPPGTYVLRLMALKPLGDPHNPAHWDVWTSGTIKVVYD